MNDSGAVGLSAGTISARIDRLPATRTIWTIVALLGFGMFFELYDLLFSAYVAPSLVKSGVLTATTTGLFGTTGVASFIAALFTGLFIGTLLCGFLADRFGRRAIFTWSLLWYSAANLMVALQHDAAGINFWRLICGIGLGVEMVTIGAYLSELAPKGLRGRAFADQPGDRLRRRAGRFVPRLRACADRAVGARGLALGGADRGGRGAGRRLLAAGLAGKPALARQAGTARRGGPSLARNRSQGRGGVRPAAAAARPRGAGFTGEPLSGLMASRRSRPGHPDERLQHLSDDRILRLQQLGAIAARQAGDHHLDQPRLHDRDRARGARSGRSSDSFSATGSSANGSSSPRRARSSSAASFLARRSVRRSLSPWGWG